MYIRIFYNNFSGVYVRMSDLVPFLEGYERQGDGSENLDVLLRQTMEKTLLWKKVGRLNASKKSSLMKATTEVLTVPNLG